MELSYDTVRRILDKTLGDCGEYEYCHQYGEPGYRFPTDATTPIVILGDYWCRCGKVLREDGSPDLHDYAHHYPRLWARMEAQGVEFEWYDEWTIDYDNDKAYRTTADSYLWQPSLIVTDDGEYLTPDDDIETWIEWADRNPSHCIPNAVYSGADLIGEGFRQENTDRFYNGWHDGMTDDPNKILERVAKFYDEDANIVFTLDETSQFYIGFSVYVREQETDDDETEEDES